MHYTGIGSRETPESILRLMELLACRLHREGWTLRSGGADGADSAFESGAFDNKEIYLPWRGFNKNNSKLWPPLPGAFEMASIVHPAWRKLTSAGKKLHARNCHQVYGINLNREDVSSFVVCWTPDGKPVGGTRTAIMLAMQAGVPIYNLAVKDDRATVEALLASEVSVGHSLEIPNQPQV